MPSSGCTKVQYPSLTRAAAALRAMTASANPRRREVAIHPCTQCRGFHLTSDRKSMKNKWMRMADSSFAKPSLQVEASR